MTKGTKLSEFEKGEITVLKRVGKPQREISKVLGCSKIVICNYLKSPNKHGTRKPTDRPEKIQGRIVHEVKKKTSSTSKILKSLIDAPCSTKTIRRHLKNEKIKHKKIIHRPRLTMKHKKKRLEYAHQYQTMNTKKRRKDVFSDEKKFNLDDPDGFQKYWHPKSFPEENYSSTRHSGGGSLMIWVGGLFISRKT